jgi:hypothetical protein
LRRSQTFTARVQPNTSENPQAGNEARRQSARVSRDSLGMPSARWRAKDKRDGDRRGQ